MNRYPMGVRPSQNLLSAHVDVALKQIKLTNILEVLSLFYILLDKTYCFGSITFQLFTLKEIYGFQST